MIIENSRKEYQIRELTVKKESGAICLNWRFKEGSHFLICLYDSRKELKLETIFAELEENGQSDDTIVHSTQKQIYAKGNGSLKVFCLREKEFVQNNKSFVLPAGELKKGIPYSIAVYVCNYDANEEILHVYEAQKDENICFFPVTITADITYRKKLFSKQKQCILRLPRLEDYKDGAIMYHVQGISEDFPLPAACLGKGMIIMIPKGAEVSIHIRDEYKKYYRKA